MRVCLLVVFFTGVAIAAPVSNPAKVSFQRQIRPLLSENCFHCHGPDAGTRMAGLRLDTREGAFAERKPGPALVAGQPEASRLWLRVNETREARVMPPPASHRKLTAAQKQLLKDWITQGAPWEEHWSFVAPKRATPPAVVDPAKWVKNPIDQFILAKLQSANLQPAPEADRRTLIRRVSLDLNGLPPSPAEVEAFVNDKSPNAYGNLVDRLMARPQWGEHRGRYWLDAARYADTHGLHIDNYREIWPYRNWVIQALNRNMPFDQFTLEQLAGDLLQNATMDQQIASGFNRCNITTNEGGAIPEEVDAIYQKDRVETTSTVFLGLTLGCAVCHDHKFDPLAQKEFYQMVAFFKNTTQKPMDGNISDTPPTIIVPRLEDRERWLQVQNEEKETRAKIASERAASLKNFEAWVHARPRITSPLPGETLAEPATLEAGVTWAEGTAPGSRALAFTEKGKLEMPGPALSADKPFSVAAWVYLPVAEDNFTLLSQEAKGHGWTLESTGRVLIFRLLGDAEKDRIEARASNANRLPTKAWTHVAVTYDGGRDYSAFSIYVNGLPVAMEGTGDSVARLAGEINSGTPVRWGWNGGTRYFAGGKLQDVLVSTNLLNDEQVRMLADWPKVKAALAAETLDEAGREVLGRQYVNRENPGFGALNTKLSALVAERKRIRRAGAITHVMYEKTDSMPSANILFRGQYDQPRDKVTPGVPAALPPMAASLPRNRLGLAQWLIDSGNPLMARVTVNRFWQELFGKGLVRTAEDFGSQGEVPSHPELLDWMAVEFRESGWDMKKFYRMMVMSSTYRQAATATPEKLKLDAENRLLSRGPRFRMDAEMVRDYALSVSGLLNPEIGGPSVKPYQPKGVWETVAMLQSNTRNYKEDEGNKLYRRSMYTFWKRSAPPASMDIFNAPSRENCTVRRERTNTPLQALVTMNDPQYVEAARYLAERLLRLPAGRTEFLARQVLGRPFDARETLIVQRAQADYLAHYKLHPAEAKKLIATGASVPDAKLSAPELAAWTMVANQVLNLDEVLNK
ncbi:MAG: DUF1553 domain-containing protein [Bryobacteraceae bacterium]|nr:DUF1553 domain-containing protein [Bryobacteraceae bacterium]